MVELGDGDELELRITPVVKLGDATVRMLAYNGSVPGPTLRVHQGSELVVNAINEGDLEATVHWHGLRLENRYDGSPRDPLGARELSGNLSTTIAYGVSVRATVRRIEVADIHHMPS